MNHKLNLKDEITVFVKSYRYPQIRKQEVDSQIDQMLTARCIRKKIVYGYWLLKTRQTNYWW